MTESRINCFITVASCKSFTHAAELLFISQPSVSKQVAQLEAELGFSLLNRKQDSVSLTDIGRLYYDFFRSQAEELKALNKKATEMLSSLSGNLNVAFPHQWGLSSFSNRFLNLTAKHPNITFTFIGYPSSSIPTIARNSDIDIAICPSYLINSYGNISRHLCDIKPMLLCPKTAENFTETHLESHTVFTDIPYGSPVDLIDKLCRMLKVYSMPFKRASDMSLDVINKENKDCYFFSDEWATLLESSNHTQMFLDFKIPVMLTFQNSERKNLKNFVVNELCSSEDNSIA